MSKPCKCTKTRRCNVHAAEHVAAYEGARAARPADVAAREDAKVAQEAAAFRALLLAIRLPSPA